MSLRAGLIVALLLTLALAARGDGIWSGGGAIGRDGIANKNAIGMGGISAVSAVGGSGCSNGGTVLSTTCGVLTFAAIGIL